MRNINNLCIGQVLHQRGTGRGRVVKLTAANELQFEVLLESGALAYADNANAHIWEIDDEPLSHDTPIAN